MSNRIKLMRIGLALLIMLALVAYFVPLVPIQIDCASIPNGAEVPSGCITSTSTITSYESSSRALLGHGAYLDYSGFYDPGVLVGTTSLTLSGVITFIIAPACVLAGLLVLGKARVNNITKALIRVLGGGPRTP